ncbi:MAG: hypothetical protein ABGZ17_12575 [Planctomycetaceae bacterium]
MSEESSENFSPSTVPDLDFLPASYRKKLRRRQKQIWRRGILGVFLLLIVIGSLQQQQTHRRLQRQLNKLHVQVKSMMDPLQDPQAIQADIRDLDRQCNLVSQLRIRIATTRLLEAISRRRPRFVSLSDIHLTYETAVEPPVATKTDDGKRRTSSSEKEPTDPFLVDLNQVRTKRRSQDLIVVISGLAPNHLAVAQYMAALQNVGYFKQLWLVSNEPHLFAQQKLRSFTIRLQVRRPAEKPVPEQHEDSDSAAGQSVAHNSSIPRSVN